MEEKALLNKDLAIDKAKFYNSVENNIIGGDFADQLEWGLMIVQGKFKQIRLAEYIPPVNASHFDKAFLLTGDLHTNLNFYAPFSDMQAGPDIFPGINIKTFIVGETITLQKTKELDLKTKRSLNIKKKHAFEMSEAFFKNDTESFYGQRRGYELNPSFFNILKNEKLNLNDLPSPISLHPNYLVPDNAIKYMEPADVVDIIKRISMTYQIALSMYYEWSIYIKEYDNIGFTIPIESSMLSEIYKSSMMKFDSKKKMIYFVRDHYRRKIAKPNEDYSIYVKKYLRGEHKFNYNGFYAEIIPPKYELGRSSTKKKFLDTLS